MGTLLDGMVETINYSEKNRSAWALIFRIFGGVIALVGILLAVFLSGNLSGFSLVMLLGLDICLILAGAACIYLPFNFVSEQPNFFLYDREAEENLPNDSLNFQMVNSRMTLFLRRISSSQSELWIANTLGNALVNFGENDLFKPLVAYKMLYDLAAQDKPESWGLFLNAPEATILSLIETLETNRDAEMGKMLLSLYRERSGDAARLRDFLVNNKKYLQSKTVQYVCVHLDEFSSKDGMGLL